jgi:hypothetical protein
VYADYGAIRPILPAENIQIWRKVRRLRHWQYGLRLGVTARGAPLSVFQPCICGKTANKALLFNVFESSYLYAD